MSASVSRPRFWASAAAAILAALLPVSQAYAAPEDILQPGTEIVFPEGNGTFLECTAGFLVTTTDPTPAFLTAGHCIPAVNKPLYTVTGQDTDQLAFAGNSRVVSFTGLEGDQEHSRVGTTDIALVDLKSSSVPKSPLLVNGIRVSGASTPDDLRAARPVLCKVGAVTGVTCGDMDRIVGDSILFFARAEHGDSGAPVVAQWPDGQYTAVGILSGIVVGPGENRITAQLVSPWLHAWSLQLVQ